MVLIRTSEAQDPKAVDGGAGRVRHTHYIAACQGAQCRTDWVGLQQGIEEHSHSGGTVYMKS
jgi:hypothetical protein